jgi:hypothetical protein
MHQLKMQLACFGQESFENEKFTPRAEFPFGKMAMVVIVAFAGYKNFKMFCKEPKKLVAEIIEEKEKPKKTWEIWIGKCLDICVGEAN